MNKISMFLSGLAVILSTSGLFWHIHPVQQSLPNLTPILNQALGGVVSIRESGTTRDKGTAFVIRSDGLLLTSKHVVDPLENIYSVHFMDGKDYPIQHIWALSGVDLAILQITPEYALNTPLFASDIPRVGQLILGIGNGVPQYPFHTRIGVISHMETNLVLDDGRNFSGLALVDMPLYPGDSGGPIYSFSGEVIGIATATTNGDYHVGFFLPLTRAIIDNYIFFVSNVK